MVQVPITSRNVVELQPETRNRFQYSAPRNFVGPAIEQAGQALGQSAEALDAIGKLHDQAVVKEAANTVTQHYAEIGYTGPNAYYNKQGRDALDTRPTVEKSLDSLIEQQKSGLQNKRQRDMFDDAIGPQRIQWGVQIAQHADKETLAYETDQSNSRLALSSQMAALTFAQNPAESEEHLQTGLHEVDSQARLHGWDDATTKVKKLEFTSGVYKNIAVGLTSGPTGSAYNAVEFANRHRSAMTSEDYNAVVSAYGRSAIQEAVMLESDGIPPPSSAVTESGDGRRLDPIAFFKTFISAHEGSALVTDSNGSAVKYGVNAAYNPHASVGDMTEARAAQIFKEKYYGPSGAGNLPPALAAVHADTYWLNQKEAKRILKESGGDVDKYIALRREFLNGLATSNPAKYGRYQKGWENRTRELADYANMLGGDGHASGIAVGPDTSLAEYRRRTMARTDIGLTFKTMLIERAEQKRSEARQDRSIQEDDAQRTLTQTVTGLGDKFTDVKQLPQDAWLRASPATRETFTQMAETNRENKPIPPDVLSEIGFLQTFSPEKLADPKVLGELGRRGVPANKLAELAHQGGEALGQIAGAKADPAPRSTLEALAKDPFKSAGFDFWSTETDKKKNPKGFAAEERDEAQRRTQLLNYLDSEAHAWAVNNPGKAADTKTMQQWIGTALIRVNTPRGGLPVGSLTDDEIIQSYGANNVAVAQQRLRSAGIPPDAANTANYLRRLFMRNHGLQ